MRGESALYGPDGSATRELALQLRADLPGVTSMRQIQILADTMDIRLIIANEATPTDPAFEIRLDLPGVCDSDAVGAKWSTRTRVLRVMLPLMPTQNPKAVRRLMTINSLAADLATPTSDGSWPDELPPLVASSDEDDDWEEDDDKGDAWGSPPSSPRVTPALIARLGDWIASSAQVATPPRPIFRRILPVFG